MMTKTFRTLPALAGAAALALTLSACGGDESATAPAPAATTEAPPSAPATSAAPSASASASASDASPSSTTSAPGGSTSTPSGDTSTRVDDRAEIDVDDQRGDGTTIRLQQVRITEGTGFVAIFTRDNVLLGSAVVTPNDVPTSVDLTDPVPATGELTAVLFGDDGDGELDVDSDPRLIEADDDDNDADDNDYADDNDTVEEDFDYTLS